MTTHTTKATEKLRVATSIDGRDAIPAAQYFDGRRQNDDLRRDFDARRDAAPRVLTRHCPWCGVRHGLMVPRHLQPGDDVIIDARQTALEDRCWYMLGGRLWEGRR